MTRVRFVIFAIVGTVVLATITASTILAGGLNYEGEDFCQEHPAWPNGTYLGQMHPFHSDFYRGYAERRGWDPCTTWAADQRHSAIKGLRALGYSVTVPGLPPVDVERLGHMGLFGQCRDPEGTYVRIIDVTEGRWGCYGVIVDGSVYFGTIELARSNGDAVYVSRLPTGTPVFVRTLYFLTGPTGYTPFSKTIRTFHTEKGLDPLSISHWAW